MTRPEQNRPRRAKAAAVDLVNHPPHYTSHPSGVECITVVENMPFNVGNAVKYIWRADGKGAPLQDLQKAMWYVKRENARIADLHGRGQTWKALPGKTPPGVNPKKIAKYMGKNLGKTFLCLWESYARGAPRNFC